MAPSATESLAIGYFVLAMLYTIVRGTAVTVLAGVAFVLMVLGALPRQRALAFLIGASVILLLQTGARSFEGFTDASGTPVDVSGAPAEEEKKAAPTPEETEAAAKKDAEEKAASEKFATQRPMLPDHRERREPLELGKPYKLPSESDDAGYHLDAGTTFLNAYKALKPDQIAAMTRDTQELLATQKSLVGMLESFGPLMKDMNKISGFLGGK